MKKYCLIFFFLLSSGYLFAGGGNISAGARSSAVANASVCYTDLWSAFNNQAGLAGIKKFTAGVYFENRFGISELGVKSFALGIPAGESAAIALSGTYFGYSLYNEKKIGLGVGKSFGKIKAGIQIDYLSTVIAEDYGNRTSFTGEAGIIAEPIQNLLLGFHIYNPTQAKIADYADERIPVIMRLGALYKFSEKVLVSVEDEKEVDAENIVKAGIDYRIAEVLYLRAGFATNPALSSFGFGLKFGQFVLDAAASFHQVLGFTPHISLQYEVK
jgi:hypothetical protein